MLLLFLSTHAGSSSQLHKIVPLLGFLLILSQIKQLVYDQHLKSVTPSDARNHLLHPKLKLAKREQQTNQLEGQIPVSRRRVNELVNKSERKQGNEIKKKLMAGLLFLPQAHEGPPDPFAFMVGLLTLLRQFHVDVLHEFLEIVGQYIRIHMLHTTAMGSGANDQGRSSRNDKEMSIQGYDVLNRANSSAADWELGRNRRNTPQDQVVHSIYWAVNPSMIFLKATISAA